MNREELESYIASLFEDQYQNASDGEGSQTESLADLQRQEEHMDVSEANLD